MDLNTHPKIAAALLSVFQNPQMSIPASQAEEVVEMKSWLKAIQEGALVVTPAAATPKLAPEA